MPPTSDIPLLALGISVVLITPGPTNTLLGTPGVTVADLLVASRYLWLQSQEVEVVGQSCARTGLIATPGPRIRAMLELLHSAGL
jgi:hypothetical protein